MSGTAAKLLAATFALLPVAAAAQDAANGEVVFGKCKMCHQIGEGARNAVGPVLTGVVGRPAGSVADYRYGNDLAAAGEAGLVWDAEALMAWLSGPSDYLAEVLGKPGARAKMSFKLTDEGDRRDVIAYLATFSD